MRFDIAGESFYNNLDPTTGSTSITTGSRVGTPFIRAGSHYVVVDVASPGAPIGISGRNILILQVDFAQSSVTVTSSKSNPGLGELVTLTATVNAPGRVGGDSVDFFGGADGKQPLGRASLLNNGTASLVNFDRLPGGTNKIVAVYNSTAPSLLGSTSAPITVDVSKVTTDVRMSVVNQFGIEAGNVMEATINVTQNGGVTQGIPASGSFRVKVGGSLVASGAVVNGSGRADIGPVSLVQYGQTSDTFVRFDLEYDGDDRYAAGTGFVSIFIKKTAPRGMTVVPTTSSVPAGNPVTFNATVTGAGGLVPTGTVTFIDNDTAANLGTIALSGGVARLTVNTPNNASRSMSVYATYNGSADYSGTFQMGQVLLTGPQATITLATSNATPNFGTPVTLTATVTGNSPTGNVTFKDGATVLGTVALSGNTAVLTTSSLSGGTRSITATYAGDTANSGNTSSPVTVTVAPLATTTALQASTTSASFGGSVTLTATVSGGSSPTGTITFKDGATTLATVALAGGSAAHSTTALATGTRSITAVYSGDSNNSTSTSSAQSIRINPATSSVALQVSQANPVFGTNITFTATLTPAGGTGVVTFRNGSTVLGTATPSGGVATFSTAALAVGNASITAAYAGDSNTTTATSSAVTVSVAKVTPVVGIAASTTTPAHGAPVTLTATVTGSTPTGQVTFLNTSTNTSTNANISNGTATLTLSNLGPGANAFVATYLGDTNNATASSASLAINVGPAPSSVSVSANPGTTTFGTAVTLTATINGVTPTGTVTFKDGATTLGTATVSNGTATLTTGALALGSRSVTAVYSGDAKNQTATSPAQTVMIDPAVSAVTLQISNLSPSFGTSITLTATVLGVKPSGTVTFKDGATTLGTVALSNGTATLAIATLALGSHSLTAVYSGDASNRTGSSSAQSVTVGKSSNVLSLTATPSTVQYGEKVDFSVRIASATATGTVTYKNGATTLGTSALANGGSTFSTTSLGIGSHSITAEYSGDAGNLPATSPAASVTVNSPAVGVTLQANPTQANHGAPVTFTATVAGLNPTGTVTFTDSTAGNQLGSASISAGVATFTTTSLAPGARAIVASYGGDGANAPRSSSPLTLTIGQATSSVTLSSSSATPQHGSIVTLTAIVTGVNPGGTVTFTSSNAGYSFGTVNVTNGKAELATHLSLGAHHITAIYSGDASNLRSVSNALTLTVVVPSSTLVLTASSLAPGLGDELTLSTTFDGASIGATGTVTFRTGTKTLGVSPVLRGRTASYSTKDLELGTHTVTASYSGDSNYPAMTSAPLTITVKPPTPTVSETPITVNYGSGGQIDLSSSVSGDTTCVEIVKAPSNGTVTVSCNNPGAAAAMRAPRAARRTAPTGSIKVNYVPRPGFFGSDSFAIVAISPGGRSNAATVSLVVPARANPALNAEVQGLVNAQVSTVRRLGQSQIANVSGRLEQLHDEDLPPVSMGLAFTAPEPQNEVRSFRDLTDPNARSSRQFGSMQKLNRDLDRSMGQLGQAQAPKKQGPTVFAVWTAGTISLGELNNQGGTTSRFTTEGVTAGIDMRVMDGLRVGFAIGFGADRTKIGALGTKSSGQNVSGTVYASYRVMPQTFIDMLAGYGQVRLNSRRFDTVNSVFLEGSRAGHEFHGAVALTYEARIGNWKIAPYGRLELLHVNLNAFTEEGLGIAALSFGSLSSTSYSGVLGLRTSYPFEMSWGTLTAMGRVEYRQTSEGGYTQALGYADTAGPSPYSIVNRSSGSGQLTLGIGAKALFNGGTAFDLEHQFSTSLSTRRNFSNTTRGRYILNF